MRDNQNNQEKTLLLTLPLDQDQPRKSQFLQYLLIGLGIFFLLQDLLAEIFKNVSMLNKLIKSVDELSSLLLFWLVMFTRMTRGRFFPALNINWPLLAFVILLLTPSIIYAIQPFIIISQLIIYVKAFLYLYIFASLNMTKPFLYKCLRTFFGAAVILFLLGLVDLVAPVAFRRLTGNNIGVEYKFGIPAVKSLFIHPALMGWFMSFISLFSFAYFLVCKKTKFLWASLIFAIGCFLSLRIKSFAGLGAGLILGFLLAPLKPKIKVNIFIVLLPLIIITLVIAMPIASNLVKTKLQFYFYSEAAMDIARNVLTFRSFQVARDYFPLGAGLGRYGSHLSVLYYSPLYYTYGLSNVFGITRDHPSFITDTFWPMIIGESGYIGLGLYVLIFLLMVKIIFEEIKKETDADNKAFQFGTLLVVIEGLVESVAAPIFTSPPPGLFILGAVGICYALRRARLLNQRTGLL